MRILSTRTALYPKRLGSLDSCRQIVIRAGYGIRLLSVGLGIAVRQELRVSGMRLGHCVSMLDRTKVLLGSSRDFSDKSEQSAGIGAIYTSDLLDGIQIGQFSTVEDQVVFPPNLGNSVNRKADKLIDGNRSVKQQKGKRTNVNE